MKLGAPAGASPSDILALWKARRLNFYDEFNRTLEDTDFWVSAGDAGSFAPIVLSDEPTIWRLNTGNVIDNDRYITGAGATKNKRFTPWETGFLTVTWEARLKLVATAAISAFWGLFEAPSTDYEETLAFCAHFFADPAITNTFRVRSYRVAEEETDTLIALDTDLHIFKIVWTYTSVLFYIDDVLVATHATQVPDRSLASEILLRTEAAGVKSLGIDYVRVEMS